MYKLIGVALLTLVLAGCEFFNPFSALIGIGIMWYEGEAHKYYNTDQATIHTALKSVLYELNFPIEREEKYDDYIYIVADTGDRFKIRIWDVRYNVTKLSIRINIMGDKPYAEMIYRHVDRQPGVRDFATVEELKAALAEPVSQEH